MTTITLRDKLAALEAERDLLRAQLAKARHQKKALRGDDHRRVPRHPQQARPLNRRLGRTPRPVAPPAAALRQPTVADPVAKLLRLAIRIGFTADDLKAI